MTSKNESSAPRSVSFSVSGWRLALRMALILILITLNYALLGSIWEHYRHATLSTFNPSTDFISLLVVLFFDATMLLPALVQASAVEVDPGGIVIKTLLWKSQLKWVDITWFSKPATTNFAVIRARKCIYLIAKRDFANFDELVDIIASRITKPTHRL